MTTNTPLHADHQLDQLAGQFEHWRQSRSHPGERIPQHLWEQAAALARMLPYSRVAQHVRVSPSDRKKHMAAPPGTTSAVSPTPPGFVDSATRTRLAPDVTGPGDRDRASRWGASPRALP